MILSDQEYMRYFIKDDVAMATTQEDIAESFTEVTKEDYDIMAQQIIEDRIARVAEVTLRIKEANETAKEDKVQSLIIAGLPEAAARILVEKNI